MLRSNKEGPLSSLMEVFMIFRVKYFDIELAQFQIKIVYNKEDLLTLLSSILNDEHKSLKSVNKL